jgi:hypothetical protein
VTVFAYPLPPEDLAAVFDRNGGEWFRSLDNTPSRRDVPGGWWKPTSGKLSAKEWTDLLVANGPLSTERLRCAARIELESPTSDAEWDMLRCVHVPGHSGLHLPDLDALKWDEREHADPAAPCLQCGKHVEISHWSKFCKVDGTSRDVSHWCCPDACQLGDWCPR